MNHRVNQRLHLPKIAPKVTNNSRSQQGGSSSINQRWRVLRYSGAISIAFFYYMSHCFNFESPVIDDNSRAIDDLFVSATALSLSTPATTTTGGIKDESTFIIQKAYNQTYAHVLPCDESLRGMNCWIKTINYFRPRRRKNDDSISSEDSHNVTDEAQMSPPPSVPWWFQTFLRDLKYNQAFGWWQEKFFYTPHMKFCTIAKVGCSEWHAICDDDPTICAPVELDPNETEKWIDAPRAVFLRDPLERLLSAFLNKCIDVPDEGHCEPNPVFNPNVTQVNVRGDSDFGYTIEPLLEDIEDNKKQLFAAYLDIMPLKWNLHVLPQSLACDLYRTINQYDFVGYMNEDFHFHLERMVNQFGGNLDNVLDGAFGYKQYTVDRNNKHKNVGTLKDHGTLAKIRVREYYTAATVRKGLEFMSIDYILLGLDVPDWAKEMLNDDTV